MKRSVDGPIDVAISATHCERALASRGLRPTARVRDPAGAFDIVVSAPFGAGTVIRCVVTPKPSDYRVLETMLAEGDFDRAALVYYDAKQPHLSDEIESWSIADVDKLAASLAGMAA